MPLPPSLAERYRLIRPIGKGRSVVYEAIDLRLSNRRCAIKILDVDQESREKIAHEISILALYAPELFFIPHVYDSGNDGTQAYIVMEYVEGETLNPPWDPVQAEQFVRTMLRYLIQLHAVGIIHRDLKPQNIICTRSADRPYVLIDFGIAKYGPETLTSARDQLSVDYAAPEQFISTTDVRSDLFSLGATAYTLLVGSPPPSAMKRSHNETFVSPGQFVPQVSPALDSLITEMLRLQPEHRPPSAEAALNLLDELSSTTVQVDRSSYRADTTLRTVVNTDVHKPEAQLSSTRAKERPALRYIWLILLIFSAILLLMTQFISRSKRDFADATQTARQQLDPTSGEPTPSTSITVANTTTSSIPTATLTPTVIPVISICKEAGRKKLGGFDFPRSQGVVIYNYASTKGAVINDRVRIVKVHQNGLLIGYHATDGNASNGLSYLSNTTMIDCNAPGQTNGMNINAIAVDQAGRVLVGGEHGGLVVFDRMEARHYDTKNVLPSDEIFGLNTQGERVWISTRKGIATVEHGDEWNTLYQAAQNLSIASDEVTSVAVDSSGWVWVGHINSGISLLRTGQPWKHYPTQQHEFSGTQIRDILVLKKDGQDQIWIATADGGVILYQNNSWKTFNTSNGLPSNNVQDIAVDKHQRLWFATSKGVVFFDGQDWFTYNTLPTFSIDFGTTSNPSCSGCHFDDDSVWTGTMDQGLTYSRLPYPDQAFDVVRICFWLPDQPQNCPQLTQSSMTVTATYTATTLQPNEKLYFLLDITPRGGYTLSKFRGDQLLNVDPDNRILFGVHDNIDVEKEIAPGELFEFFDSNKPLTAMDLDACQREKDELVCTSSWRLWVRTRHAGPLIRLVFRVKAPLAMPASTQAR